MVNSVPRPVVVLLPHSRSKNYNGPAELERGIAKSFAFRYPVPMVKMLTTKQAAELLSSDGRAVTIRRVQQMAAAEGIERTGRSLLIPASTVERWRKRPAQGRPETPGTYWSDYRRRRRGKTDNAA